MQILCGQYYRYALKSGTIATSKISPVFNNGYISLLFGFEWKISTKISRNSLYCSGSLYHIPHKKKKKKVFPADTGVVFGTLQVSGPALSTACACILEHLVSVGGTVWRGQGTFGKWSLAGWRASLGADFEN